MRQSPSGRMAKNAQPGGPRDLPASVLLKAHLDDDVVGDLRVGPIFRIVPGSSGARGLHNDGRGRPRRQRRVCACAAAAGMRQERGDAQAVSPESGVPGVNGQMGEAQFRDLLKELIRRTSVGGPCDDGDGATARVLEGFDALRGRTGRRPKMIIGLRREGPNAKRVRQRGQGRGWARQAFKDYLNGWSKTATVPGWGVSSARLRKSSTGALAYLHPLFGPRRPGRWRCGDLVR